MTARTRRAQARVMPRAEDMREGDDHHQRIRAIEFMPAIATFHIKVFAEAGRPGSLVRSGDNKFQFAASEDMDEMYFTHAECYVTTASSSGIVQVQLVNMTQGDMLSTRLQIDQNELHSRTAAVQPVIDETNTFCNNGTRFRIDVDAAGTGARGLGVMMEFMR